MRKVQIPKWTWYLYWFRSGGGGRARSSVKPSLIYIILGGPAHHHAPTSVTFISHHNM